MEGDGILSLHIGADGIWGLKGGVGLGLVT